MTFLIVGLGSLAFSQLNFSEDEPQSAEDLKQQIERLSSISSQKIEKIESSINDFSFASKKQALMQSIESAVAEGELKASDLDEISQNLTNLEKDWNKRSSEFLTNAKVMGDNLEKVSGIYNELSDAFAGRIDEATPTLRTLYKNLIAAKEEAVGIERATLIFIEETDYKLDTTSNNDSLRNNFEQSNLSVAVNSISSDGGTVSRMSSIINASEALPLNTKPPSISSSVMEEELAKAKRNIESLRSNLSESESLLRDLQKDKDLLNENYASGKSASDLIGDELGRLRSELNKARDELTENRQSMLLEQEKSTAVVKSITTELERTRTELDAARLRASQAQMEDNDLSAINAELLSVKDSLDKVKNANENGLDPEFVDNVSTRLDAAITKINSIKESDEVASSGDQAKNQPEGNNELINKLLVDLSSAKDELIKARSENRETRKDLGEKIASLEDELKSTNLELIKTVRGYDEAKLQMAKREFDYADTIKKLEEEAQVAQNALSQASLGKLPAIPFIEEMERNLADSEKRIEALSTSFDSEKEKASEVIDGLQVELENANLRQKRAMEQLGRRELELKGKSQELKQLLEENKVLQEELEVVKVISGQLQDLNSVLEETKKAQNQNLVNTDQAVLSLRDELNQAKVELVYEREEKEKLAKEASLKISSLEGQLAKFKERLQDEQENLAQQTLESKDLIFDLKSELDVAREEIARMKSVGNTESLETRKAVSQLQEALGTIRILKESLEESEKANLELDTLRSELADSMEMQITQVRRDEEQQSKLQNKISDLEAEILIFRNNENAEAVQTKKLVADLNEKIKQSQNEITKLNGLLESSEDGGLSSVIMLQDELAREQALTDDLQRQIQELLAGENNVSGTNGNFPEGNPSDLESKLLEALDEIKSLHDQLSKPNSTASNMNREMVLTLEQSLADAEASFSNLEKELMQEKANSRKALIDLEAARAKLLTLGHNPVGENEQMPLMEDSISFAESSAAALAKELTKQRAANQKLVKELEAERLKLLRNSGSTNKSQSIPYLDNQVIVDLEDSLAESESEVSALENELNMQKKKNQKLIDALNSDNENGAAVGIIEGVGNESPSIIEQSFSKITLLEKNLENALQKLEVLEAEDGGSQYSGGEAILDLENSLNESEATVAELQNQLNEQRLRNDETILELDEANRMIAAFKSPNVPMDLNSSQFGEQDYLQMEEALLGAQLEVEMLKKRLGEAGDNLESVALASVDGNASMGSQELLDINNALSKKEENIDDLEKQLSEAMDRLNEKEAELEIANALAGNFSSDSNNSQQILFLKEQLANLRSELATARSNDDSSVNTDETDLLKEKLQEAVAESFELQAELEETKLRLAAVENQQNPNEELRDQFADLLSQSQANEKKAILEIESLTEALKSSEALRQELEGLVDDFQEIGDKSEDLAQNPKILKLQQELLLLQEGLRQARNYDDPKVADLQTKLDSKTKDYEALNDDLKNAMKDFVRLKNQVESREIENERLRNNEIADLRSDAEKEIISLKNEIGGLRDKNSFLELDLQGRDKRISDMRDQLIRAQAQSNQPLSALPSTSGSSELRAKVIRLEGDLQASQDGQLSQQRIADRLNMELRQERDRIAVLEQSLRNAMNQSRSIPVTPPTPSVTVIPGPGATALSNSQKIELENLRQQNQRLQDQLASATAGTDRNLFEQQIRELNQKNLTASIQLDQERRRSLNLEKELQDALDIKRGIIEKGESANLKVELLNDELAIAQDRIQALEKTLVGAREAIRVLRSGGNERSMIKVKLDRPSSSEETRSTPRRISSLPITSRSQFSSFSPRSTSNFSATRPEIDPKVNQVPVGNASLRVRAEVQFLNNRKLPASFTEFFLLKSSLDEIARDAQISIPVNQGITSISELWARSIQRGYRFPGVAANIRNALATTSLMRLKTNSIGETSKGNIQPGNYYLIGSSTLGQVGVVWSKPIEIKQGENQIDLSLNDASWAQ